MSEKIPSPNPRTVDELLDHVKSLKGTEHEPYLTQDAREALQNFERALKNNDLQQRAAAREKVHTTFVKIGITLKPHEPRS
ncbi:MAG: hypothetical protein WAZ27_02305 [Minisyncoccia bacterium]